MSSAYLKLLIFLPAILIPACVSSSPELLSCVQLCDPMDCSLPGFSVHGIFQARILECVCHFLLQEIFPTQGLNPGLLHCRQTLYHLIHQGSHVIDAHTYKCHIQHMILLSPLPPPKTNQSDTSYPQVCLGYLSASMIIFIICTTWDVLQTPHLMCKLKELSHLLSELFKFCWKTLGEKGSC